MIRVVAPSFVAGLVLDNGLVVRGAPIVNYMVGWDEARVHWYAAKRGWRTDSWTSTSSD